MNERKALEKLEAISQIHLMQSWSLLNSSERLFLLQQIEALDVDTFLLQQATLKNPPANSIGTFEPFSNYAISGSQDDKKLGRELLEQGKMGCLIVAGGQGTRLRLEGPKGLYPISVIKKKTLFQLFAEKIVAASKQAYRPLQAAIMTSPLNHAMTLTYFDAHTHFGLKKNQCDFFMQGMLPFLNNDGNLFLQENDLIAQGPDGNGTALHHFWAQGLLTKWKELGIEHLNFAMIDNPLTDPFDAELLGFHVRNKNEITIKCVLKRDPDEKVGIIVKQKEKVRVIEYSEMPEKERHQMTSDGFLKYPCANISLFCISLSFIEKLVQQPTPLPLHLAYKLAPHLSEKEQMAWKFEYFIFDILSYAKKVQALLYLRENCFAPLKNQIGADSPTTVQTALQLRDKAIYEELFQRKAPEEPFELAQDFHYPIFSYVDRWKSKPLPNDRYLGD